MQSFSPSAAFLPQALRAALVLGTVLCVGLGSMPLPAFAAPDSEVLVPDGTEVKLRLEATLSSAAAQTDDQVIFEVVEDVVIDGQVVIAQGAMARGTVTRAQNRKSFGRRGKLQFVIDVVRAVDGHNLRLRATRSVRGRDLYATAAVVTILTGPFGIFVKGKDVEVPAGTEYLIYTDGQRSVRVG